MRHDTGVYIWWAFLTLVGLLNIGLWLRQARASKHERDAHIRWQMWLCAAYVLGCAFRGFLPRADVQRITFFDSVICSVFVGRSVATIAELSFIAQIGLTMRWLAQDKKVRWVEMLSYLPLILISCAECFSWYAVLSTNYLGNTCEESLWTITGFLSAIGGLGLVGHYSGRARAYLGASVVGFVGYVLFMIFVDVHMYFTRWRADEAAHRAYFAISDGVVDLIHRRVVTFDMNDWRTEIPWMSLYFSCAVWFSLAMFYAARKRFSSAPA
jgi:hypothetical protein